LLCFHQTSETRDIRDTHSPPLQFTGRISLLSCRTIFPPGQQIRVIPSQWGLNTTSPPRPARLKMKCVVNWIRTKCVLALERTARRQMDDYASVAECTRRVGGYVHCSSHTTHHLKAASAVPRDCRFTPHLTVKCARICTRICTINLTPPPNCLEFPFPFFRAGRRH